MPQFPRVSPRRGCVVPLSIRRSYAGFARHRPAEESHVYDVYALHQDRLGFVWVGTEHGLFRLDSHHARRFPHDSGRTSGTPGRMVFTLGEDHNGDLLLGCFDGGCARYDSHAGRFIRIDHKPIDGRDRLVRFFQPMGDGRVWIGSNGSLTAIDFRKNRVDKYYHPNPPVPSAVDAHSFLAVHALDDHAMLVGTRGGVVIVDTCTKTMRFLRCLDDDLHPLAIIAILPFRGGFIASSSRVLYHVDMTKGALVPFDLPINRSENREFFGVNALALDTVGDGLWIGTSEGLLRMEGDLSACLLFKPGPEGDATLHGSNVATMLRDRSNVLWIGTSDGISTLDLRRPFSSQVLTGDGDVEPVIVRALAEDPTGQLWLGTSRGLVEYDRQTGNRTFHSLGGSNQQMRRARDDCYNLHMGRTTLWIGSLNGLFGWDPLNRSLTHDFAPPMPDTDQDRSRHVLGLRVDGIVEDRHGYVWSGSGVNGLQRLDPCTNTFRYYVFGAADSRGVPAGQFLASLEDSNGRLWFGFSSGLARYDRANDAFEKWESDPSDPRSLSNSCVCDIYEDRHGSLWIGTAGGLNRVVEGMDGAIHFERFGIAEGLPDDFVGAITESDDALWCGVDPGVLRLRRSSSRLDVALFDPSDGMVIADRHQNAALRDSAGLILYGGLHGFDQFDPSALQPDRIPPAVALTSFKVFNREAIVADTTEKRPTRAFALARSITHMSEIVLEHRQNVISIGYAALHYRQPERIRYQYRLQGFDRQWREAGSRTEAMFTNLDPGSYTFQVRAINGDGVASVRPAELRIKVRPPIWRRWWAYSAYGGMATGVIASLVRWRIAGREREFQRQRELERVRLEEREAMRRQNASDFHDEAGTTLTRILFLAELARRRTSDDPELGKTLSDINDNAARLAQGMRDFIWVLDPDKDTLLDTLQRIEAAGDDLFGNSDTSFSATYNRQALRDVLIDVHQRRQVLMICKEALHNAARHSGAGAVTLRASVIDTRIAIEIADCGCGFVPSDDTDGYGLKSMRRRAESIDGVIRIVSDAGEGARVILEIPRLGN